MNEHDHQSAFNGISPKIAFFFGAVSSFAVLSTIGFFTLLWKTQMFEQTGKVAGAAEVETNDEGIDVGPNEVIPEEQPHPALGKTINRDQLEHIRGKGPITLVEFSDTECPFCKKFHGPMRDALTTYEGKISWAYEHFPLDSLHQKARSEANATECAADQGKFWEYIDKLFEITPSNDGLPEEELFTIAENLGLKKTKFKECVEKESFAKQVQEDADYAVSLGVEATPTTMIVNSDGIVVDVISGAVQLPQMSSRIERALSGK